MKRVILLLLTFTQLSKSQSLQLPSIFSDNMILQRDTRPPLWGKAKAGAEVKIKIGKTTLTTRANTKGEWKEYLPEPKLGIDYTLEISAGGEKKIFKNITAGDVYYCGGQSNMQYALERATGGQEEIRLVNYKNIRLFTVPRDIAYRPRFDINPKHKDQPWHGTWAVCTPQTSADFSAVAYFFGKKIHLDQNVPIGLIHVAWGGTPVEAHMSQDANKSLPYLSEDINKITEKTNNDTIPIDRKTQTPQLPSSIFNAMIHPIIPYALKGFIWYQAEQNWANPYRYRYQFRTFIEDLRVRWKQGYLPFYFVQLPGMGKKPVEPMEDFWSVLRESQNGALSLPNVGVAVTLDLAESDIHPKNKMTPGERLANLALKYIYGKNNLSQCPVFESYAVVRDTIEISLRYAAKGLFFKNDTVKGLAIAGDDHQFYWAQAKIRNNKVLVYSPYVQRPQAVRYAWGEDPPVSLFTIEGLPVSPFRTDNWPVREDGKW